MLSNIFSFCGWAPDSAFYYWVVTSKEYGNETNVNWPSYPSKKFLYKILSRSLQEIGTLVYILPNLATSYQILVRLDKIFSVMIHSQ